jgi:hypothetical protein
VIEDKHYAIAVFGIPGRYLVAETTKKLESGLKETPIFAGTENGPSAAR